MRPAILALFGCLITGGLFAADTNTTDQVKTAVAKLKDSPNYSWKVDLKLPGMPFEPGPLRGQTEKGGLSMVSQDFNDNTLQAAFSTNKTAVKFDADWMLVGGPDADDRAAMMGQWLTRNRTAAEEAESLLKNVKPLQAGDGGVLSGDLTEDGAKALLNFGPRGAGGNAPAPKNAKGSAKFWLKDGALAKFESHVQGTTAFGPDQEERELDMTRTVEIQEVGTTKLAVPAEVRTKLEAK